MRKSSKRLSPSLEGLEWRITPGGGPGTVQEGPNNQSGVNEVGDVQNGPNDPNGQHGQVGQVGQHP
ncbi:MAG: hypothetical protein NVSMB9_23360 [Isosphaeraceae bacterium]